MSLAPPPRSPPSFTHQIPSILYSPQPIKASVIKSLHTTSNHHISKGIEQNHAYMSCTSSPLNPTTPLGRSRVSEKGGQIVKPSGSQPSLLKQLLKRRLALQKRLQKQHQAGSASPSPVPVSVTSTLPSNSSKTLHSTAPHPATAPVLTPPHQQPPPPRIIHTGLHSALRHIFQNLSISTSGPQSAHCSSSKFTIILQPLPNSSKATSSLTHQDLHIPQQSPTTSTSPDSFAGPVEPAKGTNTTEDHAQAYSQSPPGAQSPIPDAAPNADQQPATSRDPRKPISIFHNPATKRSAPADDAVPPANEPRPANWCTTTRAASPRLRAHHDGAPRRGRAPLPRNRKMEFKEDRVAKKTAPSVETPAPVTEHHTAADRIVRDWLAPLRTCVHAAALLAAGDEQARPVYHKSLLRAKKALGDMRESVGIMSVEVFRRTGLLYELIALKAHDVDGQQVQMDTALARGIEEVVEVVRKRLAAARK